MLRPPPSSPLFPYTTLFRSDAGGIMSHAAIVAREYGLPAVIGTGNGTKRQNWRQTSCRRRRRRRHDPGLIKATLEVRSEEHTSELQSHHDLVCRPLLEKKKN